MDVFTERTGVGRDFQHLAVTLSRCQNIPARYVTGYIGDIRMPYSGPGDFSAWYQVFLDGQWIDLDAVTTTRGSAAFLWLRVEMLPMLPSPLASVPQISPRST